MHFSKHVALIHVALICGRVWVIKKCLYSIAHLYAMAATMWVKKCRLMFKTLSYSDFEAFGFSFDMILYYI